MINIKLKNGQTGYNVIGGYIRRYWNHNRRDEVICSIATSYDGIVYEFKNEVATPTGINDDIEFLYDWWEGEKYIKLLGIQSVSKLHITGGIYEL